MVMYAGRQWTRDELLERVGHMDQLAGIKALETADGRARGSRVYQVYTGSGLTFNVLADRALDIGACDYTGLPLAWLSAAGEAHPTYYEPLDAGWLRTFGGGLLTTCGLDQFGAPSEDAGEAFGLHGRISTIPAENVNVHKFWHGGDYHLEITGQMRQARLFGENLLLRRMIKTRLGSRTIHVIDNVTNEGYTTQPHMIMYHCNLGFPLINDHAEIRMDAERTTPRDERAEKGLENWNRFQPPQPGFEEQVFVHQVRADDDGYAQVEIRNPDLDHGLRIRYDARTLPHLVQWKMSGQGEYVLGIEPVNSSGVKGRAHARELDDLPHLEPGESRTYSLSFSVI